MDGEEEHSGTALGRGATLGDDPHLFLSAQLTQYRHADTLSHLGTWNTPRIRSCKTSGCRASCKCDPLHAAARILLRQQLYAHSRPYTKPAAPFPSSVHRCAA